MSGSQACRNSPHGPIEKEISFEGREKSIKSFSDWICLLSQILFQCFACLCYMYFYYITPLCPYYVCSNHIMIIFLWMDIILLFYRTEHNYSNYSVFCNQKQGSTKNVNTNLSGNLYGATYFFSSLASLARYLRH